MADKRLLEGKRVLAVDDEQEPIRLAAALALADLGARESLPALGKLLESELIENRIEASRTLQSLTGERMPTLGTKVVDAAGVAVLSQWIAGLGGCP